MTPEQLAEIERLAAERLQTNSELWRISDAVPAMAAELRRLWAIEVAARKHREAAHAFAQILLGQDRSGDSQAALVTRESSSELDAALDARRT